MIYRPAEKAIGLDWQAYRVIIKSAKQSGAEGSASVTVRDIS